MARGSRQPHPAASRRAAGLLAAAAFGASGCGASAAAEGLAGDALSLLQASPAYPASHVAQGGGHVYYMHIPRTAGTSFSMDASRVLFENFNLFEPTNLDSREGCYGWRNNIGSDVWVATLLRNPRNHVLSQYLLCGEGTIALMTSVQKGPGGFGLWVSEWVEKHRVISDGIVGDFTGLERPDKKPTEVQFLLFSGMPHKCYNPINLQAHHFTCMHPFMYSKNGTDGRLAMQNLRKTRFVGIQEAYQESICLFASKVAAAEELPHFCNCEDPQAWGSFSPGRFSSHSKHTKTYHNVTRHGEEVLRDIDEITALDRALYKAGVERFIDELRLVEAHSHMRILCDAKEAQLRELANLGPPPPDLG